jgi:hypothetical protein
MRSTAACLLTLALNDHAQRTMYYHHRMSTHSTSAFGWSALELRLATLEPSASGHRYLWRLPVRWPALIIGVWTWRQAERTDQTAWLAPHLNTCSLASVSLHINDESVIYTVSMARLVYDRYWCTGSYYSGLRR